MTEALWQHVLGFLDRHGSEGVGEHREELYQFADQTGILERHRQLLARPGHGNEADMKIMYYELIKMLISHDSQLAESGGQDMTGQLQRYLNQRLLSDVDTLKRRSSESQLNGLMARLARLEENQIKLEKSNKELRETNQIILGKFSSVIKSNSQSEKQVSFIKQ